MRDEVIEEIRERRKQMLREDYGGSIDRFLADAQKWEKEHPADVVDLHAKTSTSAYRRAHG